MTYSIRKNATVTLDSVRESYELASRSGGLSLPPLLADAPDSRAILRKYVDDVSRMLVENLEDYKDFDITVGKRDAERLRLLLNLVIESREVIEDDKTLK